MESVVSTQGERGRPARIGRPTQRPGRPRSLQTSPGRTRLVALDHEPGTEVKPGLLHSRSTSVFPLAPPDALTHNAGDSSRFPMQPTLLVLAAGMGSRYGGLKQLDPMGPAGETVLDYSVFDAIRAGFGRVVFVIREDFAEAFRHGIGGRFADRIPVDYAFQRLDDVPTGFRVPDDRQKPWGTAHAVRAARHLVAEPFAVINADDFYGRDAYQVIADYFRSNPPATNHKNHYAMVGYALDRTLSDHGDVNRGICRTDAAGLLTGVAEHFKIQQDPDGTVRGNRLDGTRIALPGSSIASMNFWGFTPAFFPQLEAEFTRFLTEHGHEPKAECYIPTVVDALIEQGTADCRVLETTANWFGVTYPDDKPHVVASIRALIGAGAYPTSLRGRQ